MADMLNLPMVTFAESKILDASDILEKLQDQVPLADLGQAKLTRRSDGMEIIGYDLLVNLAKGFYALAFAVHSYQEAQAYRKKQPDPERKRL